LLQEKVDRLEREKADLLNSRNLENDPQFNNRFNNNNQQSNNRDTNHINNVKYSNNKINQNQNQ